MKRSLSELMALLSLEVIDYDEDVVSDLQENADEYIRHIDFCMVFCDDPYELYLLGRLKDFIETYCLEV